MVRKSEPIVCESDSRLEDYYLRLLSNETNKNVSTYENAWKSHVQFSDFFFMHI